jgi:hypothetical protein
MQKWCRRKPVHPDFSMSLAAFRAASEWELHDFNGASETLT